MSDILSEGLTEHKIGFGEVGSSVGVVLFLAVGVAIGFAMGLAGGAIGVVGWVISGLFGVALFFFPSVHAFDVSDRIPEVKDLKANDKRFKDVNISHQYFWVIFILNLIFGATGLAWLALFFWAHAPGAVVIPSSVLQALEENASGLKQSDQVHADQPSVQTEKPEVGDMTEPASSLEAKLRELNSLVERGLITEAEAKDRRQAILEKV